MTEETIKVSLSAEVTERSRGNFRRSSIANKSSQKSGGDSRRNSTGKPNPFNGGETVIPHHLRASTGSCHDFCKYGRKHAFEVKEKQSIPKRIPTTNKQDNVAIPVPAERKKTVVAKLKVSPDSKTRSPDPPEIIKREIKVEASSKQKPSIIKKTREKSEMKVIMSTKSSVVKLKGPKPAPVTKKKPSSISLNVSVGSSGGRKSDIIKLGKMTASTTSAAAKKLRVPPTNSLSPKSSIGRVVSLIPRKTRLVKVGPPLKDQTVTPKAEHGQPNTNNMDNVPEKTLHVVEAEIKNDDVDEGIVQIPSLSPSLQSPKSLSDPSSSTLSSLGEEDAEESEYTDTEAEDDFDSEDEIVNNDEVETSKGNNCGTRRKGGVVLSEDNVQGKVKFRRGKVVDLQSENNGPRRLRFRRGRILGDNENGKGDIRRRKFKNREIDNDVNDSSPNSEKVILRHQDAQGKKDSQGLFNNVIEETANKLVETRKSKVKALVGAFETVISLQETKPTTLTASTPTET